MGPIVISKKNSELAHSSTRQATISRFDSFYSIQKYNPIKILSSNCGSISGKKSCWSVVDQDFTCINSTDVCCGDGRSCGHDQRCLNNLCVPVQTAKNICSPPV